MELPGTINPYIDPKFRERFVELAGAKAILPEWSAKIQSMQDDPEFRAGDEANLLLRKNYQALGAFRAEDRPKALDHFGFASQLVFTTACLSNFGLEQMGEVELALETARAHNRMMTSSARWTAGCWPPAMCRWSTARGRLRSPARPWRSRQDAGDRLAPSAGLLAQPHRTRSALALAQEAGVPILFHVGGEEKMAKDYLENGLPFVKDFHGGDENFTSLTFMTIPLSLWQTLSAW